ncbi:GSCOCT00013832001.3-RA-CDS, partial [Cotesia congregata]
SVEVAQGIYESQWIGTSTKIQKSLKIMMCRAQKPLVINVEGILPALTCKFYTTFLSSTLSYFMTLRALIYR